jgi:hypothetical protein
MSFERVRIWDWVTGVLGVALIAILRLDWYERPEGGASAFEAFRVIDVLLLALGFLAILVVVVTAAAKRPAVPLPALVLTFTLALLMTLTLLVRTLSPPGRDADVSLSLGAWLGLACVVALTFASYRAMRDESAPAVEPGPPPERQPVPPPTAPAHEPPAAAT